MTLFQLSELLWFTLWLCQNSYWKWPFSSLIYLLKVVIFHSYVSLPEGTQIFESTYIYINSLVNHDNSHFIMIFTQDWYLNSYLFSASNVMIILQTASLDLSELQRTERNGRGWPTRIGSSQRQRFPFGNPRWHRKAGTRSACLASMVAGGRCTVFRHLSAEILSATSARDHLVWWTMDDRYRPARMGTPSIPSKLTMADIIMRSGSGRVNGLGHMAHDGMVYNGWFMWT
jgi:hypothetical protein